jgi:hypothetical protein
VSVAKNESYLNNYYLDLEIFFAFFLFREKDLKIFFLVVIVFCSSEGSSFFIGNFA